MDITSIDYDVCKNWIKDQRERRGKDWDAIRLANKNTLRELKDFLERKCEEEGWPKFQIEDDLGENTAISEQDKSVNEWRDLVRSLQDAEESTERILRLEGQATIQGKNNDQNSAVYYPTAKTSAWQCYLERLRLKKFTQESIDAISNATLKVLKQLSADTTNKEARKGLVIGNVQSGKTANMAALMAMAADWGFNMFIVLSGTIEALRKQTQERLFSDLNNEGCNFHWRSLEHLKVPMSPGDRAQDLDFSNRSYQKYFTVTLKNGTRLTNLIKWLQADPNSQKNMKVIVIDDEADQASINTADVLNDEERKKINKLITNLVNGKNTDGTISEGRFKAMNYIGYTATPYANVLNEIKSESLFPKDFISTLAVSREYFGPQQIFGYNGAGDGDSNNYDGLNIIREVDSDDIDDIKSIHTENSIIIPRSLQNAICWFLCGVSCMRLWNYKKPISLLIHTSQKIGHHSNMAYAVSHWIMQTSVDQIINRCKNLWVEECNAFSKKLFREQYPNYAQDDCDIHDYPDFEAILPELKKLIAGERLSHIHLADDNERKYHKHIHLCIDNCARANSRDDDYVRLAYPDERQLADLDCAPAFIVVGGATLSRGLTIEGLISTYFLRSVGQADTLMQMGRWFGYRRRYELIPRIWLTTKTRRQFEFLAELDQELRDEIHTMEVKGQSPIDYGVRVNNSPKVNFIRVTAANRMQLSEPATWEFGGSMKQTFMFDNDAETLNNNLNLTQFFLNQLGKPVDHKPCNTHASHTVLWKEVPFDKRLEDFLKTFRYQERLSVFNDISPLIQWIKDATSRGSLQNWSVILAGTDNSKRNYWNVSPEIKVRKIIRNQKISGCTEGILNIGTLRTATDSLADIDLENATEELKKRMVHPESKEVNDIRILAGVNNIPQLIIYIIDKDSKAHPGSMNRKDLNAVEDVVGICINLPGEERANNVSSIAINVKKYFGTTFDGEADVVDE